jgi:hypothetical protein
MVKQIKLMADYDCYPLWVYEDMDLMDNPHPSELPLDASTVERLLQWQDTYDGILNREDPASSDFASVEDRVAFEQEGISLWQQLQKELGDEYDVFYMSELQHRLLSPPKKALIPEAVDRR